MICIGRAAVKESWTYSISIKSPSDTVEPEETISLLTRGLPHDMTAKELGVRNLELLEGCWRCSNVNVSGA